MENWSPSCNWTKEEFDKVITDTFQEKGVTATCLDVEYSDRQNMDDIMRWARKAGYYAEERCGGDSIYVSKIHPIAKSLARSKRKEEDDTFFDKLLKLLVASAPQADDYLICDMDGKIIAEFRTMRKPGTEEKCLADVLARLRDNPRAYPWAANDGAFREYWAFPILTDDRSCNHALICHGRKVVLDNIYSACAFVTKLYMLR